MVYARKKYICVEDDKLSQKGEFTGHSPTSVIQKERKAWELPVDVSFDESMNAETIISCESMCSFEENPVNNRDEPLETKALPEIEAPCIATDKTSVTSKKEESSFFGMMSQFISYTQKQTDPMRRMRSDSRRRMGCVQKPLRRNKSTGSTTKPGKMEGSRELPPLCPNNNTDNASLSKVPLKQQPSTESTIATSTNQSTSQSMTEMFDDSIVWSFSDMCSTSAPVEHDQNGTTIVFNNYITANQGTTGHLQNSNFRRSYLKNRVWTGNAQAKHSQNIRYGTSFNDIQDMDIIQTTKSFGDDFIEEEFETKQSELPVTLMMDTFGISTPCPSFCLFPSESDNQKKNMLNRNPSGEETFYDSDPGDVRFRHRRPRRAIVKDDKKLGPSMLRTNSMKSRRSRFSHYMDRSRLDIEFSDDQFLEMQVEEMKNMTMNFIWHPSQSSATTPLRIMRSRAWIEMGSLLTQTVIHPKLMWKPVYEPDLFRRKINVVAPYSIDLLDIIGIVPVKLVDRNEHPFARHWCSFKIVTVRECYFLFEAENKEMRDKIVFGLKLIIARLASKVLVAGEVAEDEFFNPGGRQVHEAWWLDQNEE